MIIQSIRLKNIKSYGEGRDGAGVLVSFQPGVNCVASGNGHGKTTLVEALGYALFLTEPDFEERFSLSTYFVRAGKSAAEIDVTFEHNGESYRVERGLGPQNRRKTKVVLVSDDSICALDEAEVSAFLCRLLGFIEHGQISELFSKLVGVKQGRLTWPFDSKPAAAKEYFEPLLDVAVFRECAERLSETQRRFDALLSEQHMKLATVQERIRERADSREKVCAREQQLAEAERQLLGSRQALEEAEKQRRVQEEREAEFNLAKARLDEATRRRELAAQTKGIEQARVNESLEATQVATRTQPGFEAYQKGEMRLRELQTQQQAKSTLQRQHSEATNARTALEAKASGARQQAADYTQEQKAREEQAEARRLKLAQGQIALAQTQPAFTALSQATDSTKAAWSAISSWRQQLVEQVREQQGRLEEVLKDWEHIRAFQPESVLHAREEEQRLDTVAQETTRKLARVEEARETLSAQLKQIGGGVCPFLQEQCRQFDPAKVQSDVRARDAEVVELRRQQREAAEALKSARLTSRELAAKEAGVAELRRSLRKRVESLLAAHARLFPIAMRQALDLIETYLGGLPRFTSLRPLAVNNSTDWWDSSEAILDTRGLQTAVLAETTLLDSLTLAFPSVTDHINERFSQFDNEHRDRLRQQHELGNEEKNLARIESEHRDSAAKIAKLTADAAASESQVLVANGRIQELDHQLKAFATLEQELQEQQQLQDRHASDHRTFLGAKPTADRLASCQQALLQATSSESQAREMEQTCAGKLEHVGRDFKPAALKHSRDAAANAATSLAIAGKASQDAQRELKAERERFSRWQAACRERDGIAREIGRLNAASSLAKLASGVLKASAPAVAQNLCNRIAATAQRIFNQINPDPIEVQWNAEPQYGLRVVPSDRRFAMLSGGEQTKLAVAMTLAMLQEFSSLRFAVFDEPTYAVDAESRPKLAEAILEAQKAAGLDQLIIVSHDNAFEGKIEHVIEVRKVAGTGTEVVTAG
jgi:exonuclease SbcC